MVIPEALDKLELMCDLAAFVGALLLCAAIQSAMSNKSPNSPRTPRAGRGWRPPSEKPESSQFVLVGGASRQPTLIPGIVLLAVVLKRRSMVVVLKMLSVK